GGIGGSLGEVLGGAINAINGGSVTVPGSTFDHNQAIGGSGGDSGSATDDPFPDYAFGGAINAEFSTSLTVPNSRFSRNQAIGGNNATATGTDIIGVGGAEGGAIL